MHLAAHEITKKIGQQNAKTLLFHTFTGCHTVAFFGGKGKKTAWDVCNIYPAVTNFLCRLLMLENVEDNCMVVIKRFVIEQVLWWK